MNNDRPASYAVSSAQAWRAGVEQAFARAGLRSTAPRGAVIDWIAASTAPFTAETLVRALERDHGISSRATIYRTVEWLRSQGWIARVHSDDTQHTYSRLLPGHHHHVVCTQCGTTLIIGGCAIEQVLAPLLAPTGFHVQGHVLELYGVCRRCRE
jgi:Fur family ferric uptake transcriptional regulator